MKCGITPCSPLRRVGRDTGVQAAACGIVASTRTPSVSASARPSPVLLEGDGE
ncbi:Uncharacterised protein [Bordetella pertussis]|nr:Uncharacterised protein [Bordetella pertussis]